MHNETASNFLVALDSLATSWKLSSRREVALVIAYALGNTQAPQVVTQKPASNASAKVLIRIAFQSYDKKTNSAPWIATVERWQAGERPEYNFLNDAYKGDSSGGSIVAELAPGTLIRVGQKNYRNKGASRLEWRTVNTDGSTSELTQSYDDTRALWLASLTAKST